MYKQGTFVKLPYSDMFTYNTLVLKIHAKVLRDKMLCLQLILKWFKGRNKNIENKWKNTKIGKYKQGVYRHSLYYSDDFKE